jgi:hypothetical protein
VTTRVTHALLICGLLVFGRAAWAVETPALPRRRERGRGAPNATDGAAPDSAAAFIQNADADADADGDRAAAAAAAGPPGGACARAERARRRLPNAGYSRLPRVQGAVAIALLRAGACRGAPPGPAAPMPGGEFRFTGFLSASFQSSAPSGASPQAIQLRLPSRRRPSTNTSFVGTARCPGSGWR